MTPRRKLLAVAVLGLGSLLLWVRAQINAHTAGPVVVSAPLSKMLVFRDRGIAEEVFATLEPGVRIVDVLDVDILRGLASGMRDDEAKKARLGPSGRWTDPIWDTDSLYIDTPSGRVSIARVPPGSGDGPPGWATMAYPKQNQTRLVIRDARLLAQLLPLLGERRIPIHVSEAGESGVGISLWATRELCQGLHLGTGAV